MLATKRLSNFGPFLASIGAHAVTFAVVSYAVNLSLSQVHPAEDILDLGYQTFDEPPQIEKQEKLVRKAPEPVVPVKQKVIPDAGPKEIQDEKGDVAGTQKAAAENQVASTQNGNATATPYYKIKPKYPQAALIAGTEGWVLLAIDITESGEVENVRVIDGEQRNTFGSEARRAVEKWKYKPFVDSNGTPIRKADHQVRVDFRLQDETNGG